MYFSGIPVSLVHQYSSSIGTLSYAFSRPMNIQCKSFYHSLHLSCTCLSAKNDHRLWVSLSLIQTVLLLCSQCLSVDSYALSHIASCCDTMAWCPGSFHSSWHVSPLFLKMGIKMKIVISLGISPNLVHCLITSDNSTQFFPNSSTHLPVICQVHFSFPTLHLLITFSVSLHLHVISSTRCCGSWPPPRIRFRPLLLVVIFFLSLRFSSFISFWKYYLHLSKSVLLDCTFSHMIGPIPDIVPSILLTCFIHTCTK